jgi:hypothetical protein
MPEPIEEINSLLFEQRNSDVRLLIDLIPFLPEPFLERVLEIARRIPAWQDFLINALNKSVTREPIFTETGRRAQELMEQLSYAQRCWVFDRYLFNIELGMGIVRVSAVESKESVGEEPIVGEEPTRKWLDDPFFLDPPENTGGGGEPREEESFNRPRPNGVLAGGEPPPKKRRDIVNVGFAHADDAARTLATDEPLKPDTSYYFWLNIGEAHKDAIDPTTPIDLDKLPEEARLTVAIFGFENELQITPGEDIGELQVQPDGTVKVARQPTANRTAPPPLSSEAHTDYLKDFLLFPIKTPITPGTYRLRCNVYCAQILVQSHLITATVTTDASLMLEACSRKLDYVLSETLRPGYLASMNATPHLLSLQMNSNGDGAHNFRFFGADGKQLFKDDVQVDGDTLKELLTQARRAMHKVSWGDEEEWSENDEATDDRYRDEIFDRPKLAKDLAYLARAGWRIYASFLQHLPLTAPQFAELMTKSGLVQIALKLSPRAVLPAAVVYDYNWKPDLFDFDNTVFELCPTFSAAIDQAQAGGPPLEDCECFKGGCALKAKIAAITAPGSNLTLNDLPPMICPSGFWGYRHSLGLPLTLDGSNNEAPPTIGFKDDLQMVACVSTDPEFVERDPHLGRLGQLKNSLKIERDEGYTAVVKRLKQGAPHVLYFYCHGGVRANTNLPYLEIGQSDKMGPEDLIGEGISWNETHPLVFINGCHTTALNPEVTLDFVSSFVQQAHAAGVVGTEVTIFEPLASKFAEACFSRFIGAPPHAEAMALGNAVRGARLELLMQGNPLGLVYIPYTLASLRLQQN